MRPHARFVPIMSNRSCKCYSGLSFPCLAFRRASLPAAEPTAHIVLGSPPQAGAGEAGRLPRSEAMETSAITVGEAFVGVAWRAWPDFPPREWPRTLPVVPMTPVRVRRCCQLSLALVVIVGVIVSDVYPFVRYDHADRFDVERLFLDAATPHGLPVNMSLQFRCT